MAGPSPERPSGILLVDKPAGPSSHDVVARVRRLFRGSKVGHTGTLDPFASGLLVLCVGPATRLAEYLVGLDKTYIATLRLGVVTDTDDRTGLILAESESWSDLDLDAIEQALSAFRGSYDQVPPQYSAKKVEGERAYRLARRGEAIELPARTVRIDEASIIEPDFPYLTLRVRCSSGTYIRSLARDLGEALLVGAHLTELRRTLVGGFAVDSAVTIEALGKPAEVARAWVEPVRALAHLPRVELDPDTVTEIRHGRAVPLSESASESGTTEALVATAPGGELVAIGAWDGSMYRPRKVFAA